MAKSITSTSDDPFFYYVKNASDWEFWTKCSRPSRR